MKTKKKIIFWLIAILEIVGCFMLFYFVLSQIANCSDVFTPLMFSLISLMLVGVSSWILLSSVDESRFGHEKNLIFAWRNNKVLVIIAILLLILFVPSMILLQSSPSFWILLTIFPDLFMVFGAYWMYRWWISICGSNEENTSLETERNHLPMFVSNEVMQKGIESTPKPKITVESSQSSLPILWIGSKEAEIYRRVISNDYPDTLVLETISYYTSWKSEINKNSISMIITSWFDSQEWEKAISYARYSAIPVIVLIKEKRFKSLSKKYKQYFVYKVSNNGSFNYFSFRTLTTRVLGKWIINLL